MHYPLKHGENSFSETAYPLILLNSKDQREGLPMKMRFTLNMEDLIVNEKQIDNMILDWIEDVSQERVLEISHQWISSQTFLTEKMIGLNKVGESSLTIEPIEG